jgi:ubiquinone/menaquinone biosynthesis C-methylase UbiE
VETVNDPSRELAQRYSREAVAYRDLWAPVLLPLAMRPLKEIDGTHLERIIEIGTGVGTLLPTLTSLYPSAYVLGVDRSQGMLALARTSGHIVLMDAMRLAIASGSFDLALMNFVLFHLPEPLTGLIEVHRVLKSGGQLVTVTWGSDLESGATKIWEEELGFHGAPAPPALETTSTRDDWVDSPDKMERLMKGAGFESVRTWRESCEHMIDADHLAGLRTSLGRCRPRYEALSPEKGASCLARARQRLSMLPPDEFLARGMVVYAVGTKA